MLYHLRTASWRWQAGPAGGGWQRLPAPLVPPTTATSARAAAPAAAPSAAATATPGAPAAASPAAAPAGVAAPPEASATTPSLPAKFRGGGGEEEGGGEDLQRLEPGRYLVVPLSAEDQEHAEIEASVGLRQARSWAVAS